MDNALMLHLLNRGNEVDRNRELHKIEKLRRKMLRDRSDPLSLPDSEFVNYFRLNKEAFLLVLQEVNEVIESSSIPSVLQLAASLRFFAEGGYQRSVGKDFDIRLARTSFCKIFSKILDILEQKLCPNWIQLDMNEEEVSKSKLHFFEKFGFPGVIGCVDGTHINLIRPSENGNNY